MRTLLRVGLGIAAAIAALLLVEARQADRGQSRRDRSAAHRREMARLDAELRRLQAENRELEAQLERLRALDALSDAPAPLPLDDLDAIPRTILDVATELHVPDAALRAAFEAARDPSALHLAHLKAEGAGGFRGLVAILRAGGDMQDIDAVFSASWDPSMEGEERALIDAAEWDVVMALVALGHCDTPRTRRYLVARLRGDATGRLLLLCAQSLGRLREPRAIPDLARAIREARSNPSVITPMARAAAVSAIGDIGGDDARAVLVDYLREPASDLLAEAASALRRVDPEAARREASSILRGPRAAHLPEGQIRSLRECAAE